MIEVEALDCLLNVEGNTAGKLSRQLGEVDGGDGFEEKETLQNLKCNQYSTQHKKIMRHRTSLTLAVLQGYDC